jgi:hypothetical protein
MDERRFCQPSLWRATASIRGVQNHTQHHGPEWKNARCDQCSMPQCIPLSPDTVGWSGTMPRQRATMQETLCRFQTLNSWCHQPQVLYKSRGKWIMAVTHCWLPSLLSFLTEELSTDTTVTAMTIPSVYMAEPKTLFQATYNQACMMQSKKFRTALAPFNANLPFTCSYAWHRRQALNCSLHHGCHVIS